MSKRSLAVLVMVAAAMTTVAGCRKAQPAAEAAGTDPIAVNVAAVTGRDEAVTLEATGSFIADEQSDVAPEASGRVVATPVDVGQFVRAGQVLIRIQGVDAGLRLDEARAAAVRAESNLKLTESQNTLAQTTAQRYQALLATGDVSRTVADQAQTQADTSLQSVATARASLEESKAQLAQAEKAVADVAVLAPFEGSISARHVSAGEYVQPSTPVVTLVKVNPLRLEISIPGVQAAQIKVGQSVTTRVDAYPDRLFTGRITAVNPVIAAVSRSFVAQATFANPGALLRPGMFGVATIDQGRTAREMDVPKAAVIEDVNTNSWRVFVIDKDNRARMRVVQLAARQDGDRLHIVSGITEDERVATTNLAQLYDTAEVKIASE